MQNIIKDIEHMEDESLVECLAAMRTTVVSFEQHICGIQTGDPEECNVSRIMLKKLVSQVPDEVLDFLYTALLGQHVEWIAQLEAESERRGL